MYRHATDVISLLFGLIFAGITGVWALQATDVIEPHDVWIAIPVILIGAGIVGLVATFKSASKPAEAWPPAPVLAQPGIDQPTPDTDTIE